MAGFSGWVKAVSAVAVIALAAGGAVWVGQSQQVVTPAVPATPGAKAIDKPLWKDLTPAQKLALEPLDGEWDKLDSIRKKKWLDIASRYATMKPDEQARMQERMREWAKMTPEQRRQVRQNFARTQKIGPSQKSTQWEEYQLLSDEQKKELAAKAPPKKQVANLPTPAQSKIKTVEPIKRPLPPPDPVPATPAATSVPPVPAPAAAPAAPAPAAAPAAPSAPAAPAPGATNVTPVPPAVPTNVK